MTMIGEPMRLNPKIQIPQWDPLDDPAAAIASFYLTDPCVFNGNAGGNASLIDSPTAVHRYLLSSELEAMEFDSLGEENMPAAVDAFSCDHFRMFEFKVRTCARGRSHDWTKCPYAHPGEKARRRDPRKYHYSGTECPELRHGSCNKGDLCEFAHGVFESWLHPDRYRTQPCRDGLSCRRRVCFFAHSSEELRIPPKQSLRSPGAKGTSISSPTSILISPSISPSSNSPPMSPNSPVTGGELFASASELVTLMHNLQLGDWKDTPQWGTQITSVFGSPRISSLQPPMSMPSTPTCNSAISVLGAFELWDKTHEEEPAMERVESGRDLRAQMYAKLMKDNSLERVRSYQQPLMSSGSQS